MKKYIVFLLVLLLIPSVQAMPGATSYWGIVSIDGITKSNALVTVYDPSGKEVGSATSLQDATYQATVPWDDLDTPDIDEGVVNGETITFKVNGNTATSRTVDAKGSNNKLDLTTGSSPSSYGGGSSGGGGGVVSAEPYENIVKKESKDGILAKDISKTFSFTTPELPVSQVAITSNVNTETISVQVELLKNRSAQVKDDAPGDVYKYLNIWVGTSGFAVPRNIKEAVVKFKLESSWITSKGFTEANISMLKWDGTQWISLVTAKTNSDDKYTYYEAKTNAFSPFAISGIKGTTVTTAAPDETEVTTENTEESTPVATKAAPGFGFVLAIAGLMAVVLRKRSN